jgi:CheY-like chemotaxis protein
MSINTKKESIFSSKTNLRFSNEEVGKEYEQVILKNFEEVRLRNIIIGILLGVLGISILISKQISQKENSLVIKISLILSVSLCFCFLLTYCFISKNIQFLYKRRLGINQFIECSNYILIKLYFDIILLLLDFSEDNPEMLIFVSISIISILTLYVFFFLKSFLQHLVCNLMIILIDCLLFKLCFSLKSNFMYYVTVLSILKTCLIVYTNDLCSKINFLIQINYISKIEKDFMKIFDGIKHSIITTDRKGNLKYANRALKEKITSTSIERNEIKDELLHCQSVLKVLKNNKFDLKHKDENTSIVINYFIGLLSSISCINDELLTINQHLYEFVYKFSQEEINNLRGDEHILKFLSFFNLDATLNLRSTKTKLNRISNLNADMINNSELPILMVKTLKNSFHAQNEEIDNFNKRNCSSHDNLLKLGKFDFKKFLNNLGNSQAAEKVDERKDYMLYFKTSKTEDLVFYIEECEKLEQTIEKNELTKLCKSLFFSKISHEFKNPICSIIETLDSLKDDSAGTEDYKHDKCETSSHFDESNTLNSFHSPISYFDKLAISRIKAKNIITPMKNTFDKINNLNCIVNILLYLVKDFTSYSNISDFKDEIQLSSQSHLNIVSPQVQKPPSLKASRNTFSNLSGKIKTNFFKEFDYHKVINNLMQIFWIKLQIDNKDSKISFNVLKKGKLPQFLEIDKELFESLIFNTFYHFYKSIDAGKVTLTIKFKQNEEEEKGDISFSFLVRGSFNLNSLNEFLLNESERVNISNISGKSYKKNVPNENYRKPTTTFETYHLENLLNNNNPVLRNNIIDSFNNNFHAHLSCLYAEKLGAEIKVNIKNKKEYIIKISLLLDQSKIVLKSPEYFSTRENTLNNRSDKLQNEIKEKNSDLTQKIGIKKIASLKSIKKKAENKKNEKNPHVFKSSVTTRNLPCKNKLMDTFKIVENEIETSEVIENSSRTINYEENLKFEYAKFMEEDSFIRNFKQTETEKQLEEWENNSIDVYELNKEFLNIKEQNEVCEQVSPKNPAQRISSRNSFSKFLTGKHSENSSKGCQAANSLGDFRGQSLGSSKKNSFNLSKKEENELYFTKPHLQENLMPKLGTYVRQTTQMSMLPNFLRVLICDDEILIQNTVKRFFNKISSDLPEYKFDIHSVDNGFECLNLIYKFYNLFKYIDILIIDETMPYMKGSHLIYLLKSMINEANFRNITIISYTSYNSSDKIDYIYMQGADFVITKPISYEQFKNFFLSNLIKS